MTTDRNSDPDDWPDESPDASEQGSDLPTVTGGSPSPREGDTRELDLDELSELTSEPPVPGRPRASTYVSEVTGSEVAQPSDRFTLTEVLGEGSQGEVCRAFDNHLQRNIAIKFPHRGGDDFVAQEILDEARKSARLNHPNVVTIYECGFWKGRPFIAMEYVDGASLAGIIKECGRISVERFLRYSDQILRALEAAHAEGLFHRDLKPHNVLMASDGTLKLTDFGIAHLRKSSGGKDKTMRVEVAGTPAYMAPEQWMGQRPDGRSDIYAFGCMAYKLLCGRAPFPREDAARHHMQTPPPPLRRFAPHIPQAIETVIMKCLGKEPRERYQTCTELRTTLERASRGAPGTADELIGGDPTSSGAGRFAVVATLVVLIAGGLTGFLAFTDPGRDLWDRAEAALGLAEAEPDDEFDTTPIKTNGGGNDETETTEADRRLEEARRLLDQARNAESPDMAIQYATRAQELAAEDSNLVNEIAGVLKDARNRKERMTEAIIVEDFEEALGRIETMRAGGDLDAAWAAILKLEDQVLATQALRMKSTDLQRAKLPLAASMGNSLAESGRFAEASNSFQVASRVADSLGDGGRRDEYDRSAALTARLDRLDALALRQPRLVLSELSSMGAKPPFRSAELLRARAWIELGFVSQARLSLQDCLSGDPPDALAKKTREIMQSLD